MRKNLFVVLVLSVIAVFMGCTSTGSHNQLFETSASESVGMSSTKLAYIDSLVATYATERKFPGGVFIVARKGKMVYYKSLGNRSLESNQPYRKDDIFRIASMTKAVTAVGIMRLYEQGKLGLDDPVARYIPAFRNSRVLDSFNAKDSSFTSIPVNKKITIRHLLTHTSGLGYGRARAGELYAIYAKLGFREGSGLSHPEWTTAELANKIAQLPLAFHPGERYLYGLNMDVLGRVIEVVSGMTLNDYFTQNIFQPLGMIDTYFYLPKEKHHRLAPIHDYTEGQMIMYREKDEWKVSRDYPKFEGARAYFGGGGLSSTAMDYARFLQALLNSSRAAEDRYPNDGAINRNYRILGRNTIELMTSDQFAKLNAEGKGRDEKIGRSYCLGFALTIQTGTDAKSPGSYEWGGSLSTKFFVDPKEELLFVGMSQAIPRYHQEFYGKLTAIIYAAIDD